MITVLEIVGLILLGSVLGAIGIVLVIERWLSGSWWWEDR